MWRQKNRKIDVTPFAQNMRDTHISVTEHFVNIYSRLLILNCHFRLQYLLSNHTKSLFFYEGWQPVQKPPRRLIYHMNS